MPLLGPMGLVRESAALPIDVFAFGTLSDGRSYFVIKVDVNTIELVASKAEAFESTPSLVDLTSAGKAVIAYNRSLSGGRTDIRFAKEN